MGNLITKIIVISIFFGVVAGCQQGPWFNNVFGKALPPGTIVAGEFDRHEAEGERMRIVYFGKFKMSNEGFESIVRDLSLEKGTAVFGFVPDCKVCGTWWSAPDREKQTNLEDRYYSTEGGLLVAVLRYQGYVYVSAQGKRSMKK